MSMLNRRRVGGFYFFSNFPARSLIDFLILKLRFNEYRQTKTKKKTNLAKFTHTKKSFANLISLFWEQS